MQRGVITGKGKTGELYRYKIHRGILSDKREVKYTGVIYL